jgi:hypothetical protein
MDPRGRFLRRYRRPHPGNLIEVAADDQERGSLFPDWDGYYKPA